MHTPVLLQEVLFWLRPQANQTFIDATLGLGGHTRKILEATAPEGPVFAFEQDAENRQSAEAHLQEFSERLVTFPKNFVTFAETLNQAGVEAVDGILFDLGISSVHLDTAARGFSFRQEGPLDMRLDPTAAVATAADIVNIAPINELTRIFREYGEEPRAFQLAREIVRVRDIKPFRTTTDLSDFIAAQSPPGRRLGGGHPAALVFQGLRIAVNDELNVLEQTLPQTIPFLKKGGRLAIISFHSLEERIVKKFFRTYAPLQKAQKYPALESALPSFPLKVLTPGAIIPSREEVEENPRARSARLRVAEKLF